MTHEKFISLDEYRKRKLAVSKAVDEEILGVLDRSQLDDISFRKILVRIYDSLLRTMAKKVSKDGYFNVGSVATSSDVNSMLITLGFGDDDQSFAVFLEYLKSQVYLIPGVLRKNIILYVGEMDSFLDSRCLKIDASGSQFVTPESVPEHNDDQTSMSIEMGTMITELNFNLREKFRHLFEVEK